jgi:hypothetical protein
MNCDICVNQKNYRTGFDDYPSCTTIFYCEKGHWENGYVTDEKDPNIDVWENCKDFKNKENE